jgi:uncharacterized Fe-S center protein
MPWIETEDCSGCGICVSKCPVGTIYLQESVAFIDMTNCIHCGVYHSVCPKGVVRHNSEKIIEEVKANVDKTKIFMEDWIDTLVVKKKNKNA